MAPAAAGSRSIQRGDATDATADATGRTKDDKGVHEQADDQREAMSAGTDHGGKAKKQLNKHDVGHLCNVTLSQRTAKAIADSFFRVVVQEHLQQHLSCMSAGQIVVLSIFHTRLSWQKAA